MLHIQRSERADGLVDALRALVADPLRDPFAPEVVAVPTRGMERWLAQRMSDRVGARTGRGDGVCANVEFPSPRRLVGDAVATASGIDADADPWLPERAAALLAGPVRVEEKLDGASVALWLRDGTIEVATRGGAGARDRAGQLGRLRAWSAERSDELRTLLEGGTVLYAEWMLLTHSIRYDALPDLLVGLDLRTAEGDFLPLAERDARLAGAGIVAPPMLYGRARRRRRARRADRPVAVRGAAPSRAPSSVRSPSPARRRGSPSGSRRGSCAPTTRRGRVLRD